MMRSRTARFDASDKIVLMMSLVSYLRANPSITVTELAAHFDVTKEVVRDAVRLLAVSGVPGATGTYLPNDLFDINWDDFIERDEVTLTHSIALEDSPRLSGREAAALVAGLAYISQFVTEEDQDALQEVRTKLAQGSSGSSKTHQILVTSNHNTQTILQIRESIRSHVQVAFDYISSQNEFTRRLVDPIRVDSVGQLHYLRAWCHTSHEIRTFRFDRMSNLEVTENNIVTNIEPDSLEDELFTPSDASLEVTFALNTDVLGLISGYSPTISQQNDDEAHVVISCADEGAVIRLVASYPGLIRVIEPTSAREAVNSWALRQIESIQAQKA